MRGGLAYPRCRCLALGYLIVILDIPLADSLEPQLVDTV